MSPVRARDERLGNRRGRRPHPRCLLPRSSSAPGTATRQRSVYLSPRRPATRDASSTDDVGAWTERNATSRRSDAARSTMMLRFPRSYTTARHVWRERVAFGCLHLDDVGTVVGELSGCERSTRPELKSMTVTPSARMSPPPSIANPWELARPRRRRRRRAPVRRSRWSPDRFRSAVGPPPRRDCRRMDAGIFDELNGDVVVAERAWQSRRATAGGPRSTTRSCPRPDIRLPAPFERTARGRPTEEGDGIVPHAVHCCTLRIPFRAASKKPAVAVVLVTNIGGV